MTEIWLSYESPTAHVQFIQANTELDFIITPYVLKSKEYAKAYAQRPKGRVAILDNGKFELVHPMGMDIVMEAAERIRADYVIPPDYFGDFEQTKRSLDKFLNVSKGRGYKIAPVVVGKDPLELAKCYDYYTTIKEIDMLCLSFLTDRVATLRLIKRVDMSKRHHLLGFDTRRELTLCMDLLQVSVSLDTSKPISATNAWKLLRDVGRGKYPRTPLENVVSTVLLYANMSTFRKWTQEALHKG